jgi:hypothetical protein
MCETGTETKTPTLATASRGVPVWNGGCQPGYMYDINIATQEPTNWVMT